MNNIFFQPAGSINALKHFNKTIANPINFNDIKNLLNQNDQTKLENQFPSGKLFIWGVVPGQSNIDFWNKTNQGDVTLFVRNKNIFTSSVVTHKTQNKRLAEKFWGYDKEGNTWEYIYFLDEIKKLNIEMKIFNEIVGYKLDYTPQKFIIVAQLKSKKAFQHFNFRSDEYFPIHSKDYYKKLLNELNGDNNNTATINIRKEQQYLKSVLFQDKKYITCGICGSELPIEFVWCSHIKKRSRCTLKEQLDINVVMPMCKLGCDDLYEKGYIAVDDGKVKVLKSTSSLVLQKYINGIDGNKCVYWNDNSKKYFLDHLLLHSNS